MTLMQKCVNGLSGLVCSSAAFLGAWFWPFGRQRAAEAPSVVDPGPDADEPGDACIDHFDWGIRLASMGKTDRAVEQFRRALEADPDDASCRYNLALALDHEGDLSEAVEHYKRVGQSAPEFADALNNLGADLLELGDTGSALLHLRKAAEMCGEDADLCYNLGCAYLKLGDHRSAVAAFRHAAAADPKDAQIRLNLALALRKADSADVAENELRDFLALAGSRYPEHSSQVLALLDAEYGG